MNVGVYITSILKTKTEFNVILFPFNYIVFTKGQYQLVAPHTHKVSCNKLVLNFWKTNMKTEIFVEKSKIFSATTRHVTAQRKLICMWVYVLKHSKAHKFALIYITTDSMRGFINKSDLYLTRKRMKFYIWNIALYGAETWTLRKIYQKQSGMVKMWWKRIETISWIDRVKNEVFLRVKWERNILDIKLPQCSECCILFSG